MPRRTLIGIVASLLGPLAPNAGAQIHPWAGAGFGFGFSGADPGVAFSLDGWLAAGVQTSPSLAFGLERTGSAGAFSDLFGRSTALLVTARYRSADRVFVPILFRAPMFLAAKVGFGTNTVRDKGRLVAGNVPTALIGFDVGNLSPSADGYTFFDLTKGFGRVNGAFSAENEMVTVHVGVALRFRFGT